MRLWSISPSYLDSKGLVACWRESLLCQNVLLGNTRGYKNHPQALRFKRDTLNKTMATIGQYLYYIYKEAKTRGYNFNIEKIEMFDKDLKLTVTRGQLEFEFEHLQKKLWTRNIEQRSLNFTERYADFEGFVDRGIKAHPLFEVIDGDIEPFERIN